MDWIALLLSCGGLLYNARKDIVCWPLWLLSNVFWGIAAYPKFIPLLILQFVFAALNYYGWYNWTKDRAKNEQ